MGGTCPEDGGQDGGGISNEDFGRDVLHGHRGERLFGARCGQRQWEAEAEGVESVAGGVKAEEA